MGKRRMTRASGPHEGVITTRMVVSRQVRIQRRRLHYSEAGMGWPIIFIHGLGGSGRWWFPLFPQLTSEDFRTLAPDLPGFGRSAGPVLDLKEAARSVIEFADHLKIDRFFLCGHSMGGLVAAYLAADFGPRVRRLALINSAGIPGPYLTRTLLRLLQPWSWCPPHFYTTLVGDVLRAGPLTMKKASRYISSTDIRPLLWRIKVPALVIWGERDGLTPIADGERIVRALEDGRLESVRSARHLPMVSHPSVVARLLAEFFREDVR